MHKKEVTNRQSKALRIVGKQQEVRTLATIRKIRSEAKGYFDCDKSPFKLNTHILFNIWQHQIRLLSVEGV